LTCIVLVVYRSGQVPRGGGGYRSGPSCCGGCALSDVTTQAAFFWEGLNLRGLALSLCCDISQGVRQRGRTALRLLRRARATLELRRPACSFIHSGFIRWLGSCPQRITTHQPTLLTFKALPTLSKCLPLRPPLTFPTYPFPSAYPRNHLTGRPPSSVYQHSSVCIWCSGTWPIRYSVDCSVTSSSSPSSPALSRPLQTAIAP